MIITKKISPLFILQFFIFNAQVLASEGAQPLDFKQGEPQSNANHNARQERRARRQAAVQSLQRIQAGVTNNTQHLQFQLAVQIHANHIHDQNMNDLGSQQANLLLKLNEVHEQTARTDKMQLLILGGVALTLLISAAQREAEEYLFCFDFPDLNKQVCYPVSGVTTINMSDAQDRVKPFSKKRVKPLSNFKKELFEHAKQCPSTRAQLKPSNNAQKHSKSKPKQPTNWHI